MDKETTKTHKEWAVLCNKRIKEYQNSPEGRKEYIRLLKKEIEKFLKFSK